MMKMRLLFILVLCGALGACASGPIYRPAANPGDYGYRDTAVTNDHIRVSFSGGYGVPQETVENYALFRAAQVTLARGDDRFRITSRETTPVTVNTGGPNALFGYGGGWGSPFWGTGIGYSTGGSSETRYRTVLDIQVGPEVPTQGSDVYNAQQVKHNLAPQVAAGAAD